MIHYTCDRCKRQINTADQTRYIVQIDIHSAADPSNIELDDDIDHLTELHQMLEGIHEHALNDEVQSSHHGQYDLCPECHRQFLKNPLGRDAMLALGFSNN
jgi:protein-arginine kinase activator protein McsA